MRRSSTKSSFTSLGCVAVAIAVFFSFAALFLMFKYAELEHDVLEIKQENAKLLHAIESSLHSTQQALKACRLDKPSPPPPPPPQSTKPISTLATIATHIAKSDKRPMCDTDRLYTTFQLFPNAHETVSLTCKIKGNLDPGYGSGVHCFGRNLIIDPTKIAVSKGGEDVLSVMGRSEEEETAKFHSGSLRIASKAQCDNIVQLTKHSSILEKFAWMNQALRSVCKQTTNDDKPLTCTEWDETPTILVHRYEYVNLYHTATELIAALVSLRSAVQHKLVREAEPMRVIFLDGHAKGTLDSLWAWVFSKSTLPTLRIGQVNTPLCLKRAIFAEIGYSAEINLHPRDTAVFNQPRPQTNNNLEDWCVMQEAIDLGRIVREMNARKEKEKPGEEGRKKLVLFIARDSTALPAHPRVRMNGGAAVVARSLQNLDLLAAKAAEIDNAQVQIVQLSKMPFDEQVALLCSADVVIAVHGAALMHMVWAHQAFFIELAPSGYLARIHFPKAAARAGVRYARLAGRGDFLRMKADEGAIEFTPEMFEQVVQWSLQPEVYRDGI